MPRAAYSDTIGSIMYTETCDARRSWSRKERWGSHKEAKRVTDREGMDGAVRHEAGSSSSGTCSTSDNV
jgi:hypothetical protein